MIGVVAALEREARCLPAGAAGLRVRVAGMGRARALDAARALALDGARALVSFGVAGALAPELRAGDALCPELVLDAQGRRFACDPQMRERVLGTLPAGATPCADALVEAAAVVGEPAAKRALFEASGAAAVDLESAAVALAAREAALPFLVLRAVSDPAAGRIPPAALAGMDAQGRVRKAAFLREVLLDPRSLLELRALGAGFRAALATLEELGPALARALPVEPAGRID